MPTPLRRVVTAAELADAAGTVGPLSDAVALALKAAGSGAVVLSWLSDTHISAPVEYSDNQIYGYAKKVDGGAQTRIALAEIGALAPSPDVFLLGGDVCDRGDFPALYRQEVDEAKRVFRNNLPVGCPVLPIYGNHDFSPDPVAPGEHDVFRSIGKGWPDSAVETDYYYVAGAGGWRIIALDSRAGIAAPQRAWLSERLREDTKTPTVVLSHGPWVGCGNWVDKLRLADDETFGMIEHAPNVKLVLSGHTHKRRAVDTGRTVHAVFPACCYGIDDATGWGVVVLSRDAVSAIFVKELKTASWSAERDYIEQAGNWSQMPIEESPPRPTPAHPGAARHPSLKRILQGWDGEGSHASHLQREYDGVLREA